MRLSPFILVWILCAVEILGAEDAPKSSKFILTAPNTLGRNKNEKFWLNIFDNPLNSDFTIRVTIWENRTELQSVVLKNAEAKLHEVEFFVPKTDEYSGNLEIHYENGKNLSTPVNFFNSKSSLFVETDKPFYKPGELVRFRILHLQDNLLPVNKPLRKVWIENPSLVKTAHWKQVQLNNGLTQLEYQLTKEPIKGDWTIKVQAENDSYALSKSFEVKEYVLPKFEVTLEPPSEFVARSNKSYSWKVCAKYSFGGPVQGDATVVFKLTPSYFYGGYRRMPGGSPAQRLLSTQGNQLRKEDGCQEFVLSTEGFDNTRGVEVTATVEEKGTGEKQVTIQTKEFQYSVAKLEWRASSRFYYPYMQFKGEFQLTEQNGKPIPNAVLDLSAAGDDAFGTHEIQNVVTDQNGKVPFTVFTGKSETEINIQAKCASSSLDICKDAIASQRIIPWFSPSDSYIAIKILNEIICDDKLSVEVLYTFHKSREGTDIEFNYMLETAGNVVNSGRGSAKATPINRDETWQNTLYRANLTSEETDVLIGRWNFEVPMASRQSTQLKLVVYYLKANQEIVASSLDLNAPKCFQNKVSSKFVEKRAEPGQTVTLSLSASAKSLCALSGVDRAVTFLDRDRALNAEKVFSKLESDSSRPYNFRAWEYNVEICDKPPTLPDLQIPTQPPAIPVEPPRSKRSIYTYYSMKEFGNSRRAFEESGLAILSTFEHSKKPCQYGDVKVDCDPCPYQRVYPVYSMSEDQLYSASFDFDSDSVPLAGMAMEMGGVPGAPPPKADLVEMRTDFPETWLWELENIRFANPKNVMTHSMISFCSPNVTKNLQLKTPHTITDWVVNTVCISKSDGIGMAPETSLRVIKPYFMDFTLPYSVKRGEILPLKVSLFNYLSHKIPIKLTFGSFTGGNLKGEQTFSTCLGAKDNLVHIFELDAKVIGKHNISVTAGLDDTLKSTCGPKETANLRDGVTKPIIIKPEGFPIETTNSLFICLKEENEIAQVSWPLQTPKNTVPNSARADVAVIGDLMGGSMENLDSLVQLPVGCGEQNMVLFVPNIVVLNYLNATDSENSKLKAKAITNMETGYQRELNYRHYDGSYSAFGKSDPEGSMWLTAFVVKSFAQAKKFIFVDKKDLSKSTNWILSHQLENGCFRQVGTVFHKSMKGGIADSSSPIALSAYILIALLESGADIEAKVFENGLHCLTKPVNETDMYSEVLFTYAVQLIDERLKTEETKRTSRFAFEYLMRKASNGNESEIFWQKDSNSLALNVEMTAYAVLTLIKVGGEENAMRAFNAVRWISKQRNSRGGFVSTQDTVVALEALATYASTLPLGSVKMDLKLTTDENTEFTFFVNPENKQILQEKEIPQVPTNLHWEAKGKGCSLIQSTLRYNLKKTIVRQDAFTLTKNVASVKPNKCDKLNLDFTLAYNLPDGASNMAVLEVELLSGYKPDSSALDELKNRIPTFKRWDFDEGKVHLYFDSIESTPLNVSFTIVQKVLVENIKPAQIKLYDYYEQESFVRAEYGLNSLTCSP